VKRALTTRQERHLVLDYLLGLPMHYLTATYGPTRQTIYRILARHEVDTNRKAAT
jgi:hypothetical protein